MLTSPIRSGMMRRKRGAKRPKEQCEQAWHFRDGFGWPRWR